MRSPIARRNRRAGALSWATAYLLEKSDPTREVISLVAGKSSAALSVRSGRYARSPDSGNEPTGRPIHLWKLAADEAGCFEQPYKFANDHARFLFYRETLSSLHYTPREDYRCTVTLMSGLPGSGKDTWLARNRPGLSIVSLDDLRVTLDVDATDDQGEVIQLARETCREHLRAGQDFAFNATNTVRQTRTRWIDLFADYAARIDIIYLEPPLALILDQNQSRSRPVPSRVIQKLVEKLEPPTASEGHSVTLIG